jgi:phage baseplate assembly protein W
MSTQNIDDAGFLGTGWSFPPTFSKAKKSVEMLKGEEDILSSLRILFSTSLNERSMRSKFGTKIANMTFEPIDSSQAAVLKAHLKDMVFLHEPRIRPLNIDVTMDELTGRVEVQLDYIIVATNNRRNFVYPFYILEGSEVPK